MLRRMNSTLTVLAVLQAQPGKENEVKRDLLSAVEPSRKDEGCINYDLHQAVDDPCRFMFHENWTSKTELDRHLAKPELQALLGRVGRMLSQPPQISLWQKIPMEL